MFDNLVKKSQTMDFLFYGINQVRASSDLKLEHLIEHLHIQPRDYQDAGL